MGVEYKTTNCKETGLSGAYKGIKILSKTRYLSKRRSLRFEIFPFCQILGPVDFGNVHSSGCVYDTIQLYCVPTLGNECCQK